MKRGWISALRLLSRQKRAVRLACVAVLLLGFLWPERLLIPVQEATPADWNHQTFWHYPWGKSGVHKGIDIFARRGTPVLAASSGLVIQTGTLSRGGNVVAILGPKWRVHYYAHLDKHLVWLGQPVRRGHPIGTVGNTGNAAGKPAHLHYSITTPLPYPWRISGEKQGWRKMFYLNPHEKLMAVSGVPAAQRLAAEPLLSTQVPLPAAGTEPLLSAEVPPAAAGTEPLETRIPPPAGYERGAAPAGSFAAWLRRLPVRPGRPEVRLHDGRTKTNQEAHFAVLDLDVGPRDLQQCADAVIRLRAEYLFSGDCGDEIAFDFTSGDAARWKDWRRGMRPRVDGNRVSWHGGAEPDAGTTSFRRYLDTVFTYAGSASLSRELVAVEDAATPAAGDVFIQGGFPGHAVIVVDVVRNEAGEHAFLLAQSFMPAQDIHVLRSFEEVSPWYRARSAGRLRTPEWEFSYGDLKRFRPTSCEAANEGRG